MSDIILKDGNYSGKIVKAHWRESEYLIRTNNPLGECLSLWIDITHNSKIKRIFCDIAITDKVKIAQLMESASVTETSDLTNKIIDLAVEKYTSKVGKISNIIRSFLPAKPIKVSAKKTNSKPPFDEDEENIVF